MANIEQIQKAAKRLEICNKCEHYLHLPKMCKKCFCVMPFKVQLEKAVCPIGEW